MHRFEVATFRADNVYEDGRHPSGVTFTDAAGDVKRRDFTINGMMYDPVEDKLLDLVGGRADLKAGVVRAVGDARERFNEDALRLMRAVRFAARLGFELHPDTYDAIVEMAPRIALISPERQAMELKYLLLDPSRERAVRLLDELGLLPHLLPEIVAMKGVTQSERWHPEGDVFEHTMRSLAALTADASWELVLAALLHDVGKPLSATDGKFIKHEKVGGETAGRICRRFKLSNREREAVVRLVKDHMMFLSARTMKDSTLTRLVTREDFANLAELHRIDAVASAGDLEDYEFVMDFHRRLLATPPPVTPLVSGDDLIARGLEPGPAFKAILDELHDAQLEGAFNDREGALRFLEDVLRRRDTDAS
jgi:poly(A) polymerase